MKNVLIEFNNGKDCVIIMYVVFKNLLVYFVYLYYILCRKIR